MQPISFPFDLHSVMLSGAYSMGKAIAPLLAVFVLIQLFKAGFRYTVEAFENSVPVDVVATIDKDSVPVDVSVQFMDAKYDDSGGVYVTPRRRRRPKSYYVTPDGEWIPDQ